MQSTNLMLAIAQIAVGLAGFSAIIVTLNVKPIRDWDETDQLNLRLLIQISIYVIFFSLLPSLLAIPLETANVWMYGLWAYGLIHFADASFFLNTMTKNTSSIFRYAAVCGICVALMQISVAWLGNEISREAMYIFTLIWHLGIVFMAFILLLYKVRKPNDT